MKKLQSNFISLLLVAALNFLFVFSIKPNHYPDNDNLKLKLMKGHPELDFTTQNFLVNQYNNINQDNLENSLFI